MALQQLLLQGYLVQEKNLLAHKFKASICVQFKVYVLWGSKKCRNSTICAVCLNRLSNFRSAPNVRLAMLRTQSIVSSTSLRYPTIGPEILRIDSKVGQPTVEVCKTDFGQYTLTGCTKQR